MAVPESSTDWRPRPPLAGWFSAVAGLGLGHRRVRIALVGVALLLLAFYWLSTLYTVNLCALPGTSRCADLGVDFRGDLYNAGHAMLHGITPYHLAALQAQARVVRAGGTVRWIASPRYPPAILLAVVPLSLVPFAAAAILFLVLSAGAVVVALRLFGVRDWRCILLVLFSPPSVYGLWVGNLSPLLLLGIALAWRWRARVRLLALAVAATIAAKLVLWPLTVWLAVTRRFRALALALVLALGAILAAWSVIGFAGLTSYPRLLSDVAYIGEARGSSMVSLLLSAGISVTGARAVALTCAACLLVAGGLAARRPDGDRGAFALIVMAALIATPVVWLHYLVLLFVPIALFSRRLSPIWFVPTLATWGPSTDLVIELVLLAWLCAQRSPDATTEPGSGDERNRAGRDALQLGSEASMRRFGDAKRSGLLALLDGDSRQGPEAGREAERAGVPRHARAPVRADRSGAGPSPDHHRPAVGEGEDGARALPGRWRAPRSDRLQRRERAPARLDPQSQGQSRG